MLQIMGPAASVSAIGRHFINDEIDYEDFIAANLTFVNGGLGSVTSVQCDCIGKNNAEIYFEKGTIYYDSAGQNLHIARDGREKETLPYSEIHPEWESGTYREIREFVETCLGEHPVTIAGEDGMKAVEVGQAAYISAREGRTVWLPLPRE
jgi:predicted dehydrogenase